MTEQQFLTERQLIIKQKTEAIKQKLLFDERNRIDNAYIDTTLRYYGYSSLECLLASSEEEHYFSERLFKLENREKVIKFFVGYTKREAEILRKNFIGFLIENYLKNSDFYVEMRMPSGRPTKQLIIKEHLVESFLKEIVMQESEFCFNCEKFIFTVEGKEQYGVLDQSDPHELWILKIKT